MIVGVGIDIVELERIQKIIGRQESAFLERIFTERERKNVPLGEARKIEFVAGRYAAKEAISKALGTGIGKVFSFQDAEILPGETGKPNVCIDASLLERITGKRGSFCHLSISHSEKYAVAQVILEIREDLSAYRE
ncbi:holo-ACP synthase [Aneurinibacillus aneurinilyticus]|jgi:holo-[acyl-carrier protein] synthase|uniref:Holo-[acyl-carrier-protein] synthase n=1 Tax=Aneurinibacillus aneurinilyticus TaxID=1391 RepID=A0A848D6N7_ANEAE|nr:holo-ACP synthase [Aneurinibacillus aneurinilyticus]MCI1696930.1 holo-ACP synthase [Aneurinibacillus aneurinilyticus]NMF01471.1 holo-ACP synthase [Aneurinibacillus aneurinilyticus]